MKEREQQKTGLTHRQKIKNHVCLIRGEKKERRERERERERKEGKKEAYRAPEEKRKKEIEE